MRSSLPVSKCVLLPLQSHVKLLLYIYELVARPLLNMAPSLSSTQNSEVDCCVASSSNRPHVFKKICMFSDPDYSLRQAEIKPERLLLLLGASIICMHAFIFLITDELFSM